MKKLEVLFFIFLFLVGSVSAQDWYVSNTNPSCLNTGPGTLVQPLCDIATANTVHQSGDTVYILPGTYHETITPKSGLGINQYTVYTGYGPREQVIIKGSDPVTGWTQCMTGCPSQNIYYVNFNSTAVREGGWVLGTMPAYVTPFGWQESGWEGGWFPTTDCWEDGLNWYTRSDLTDRTQFWRFDGTRGLADLNEPGYYYYDHPNSRLYIWPFNSDNPNTHTIECSVRAVTNGDTKDYVTISNLTLTQSFQMGINIGAYSHDVNILNNEISFSSGSGTSQANPSAIYKGSTGALRPGIRVIGNKIHDVGSDRGPFSKGFKVNHAGAVTTFYEITGAVIENNEAYNAVEGLFVKSCHNLNICYENITIRNNVVHDTNSFGISLAYAGPDISTLSSFIDGNTVYNTESVVGIGTTSFNDNVYIRHNTVYNALGIGIEGLESGQNFFVQNNIVTNVPYYREDQTVYPGQPVYFLSLGTNSYLTTTSNYNLFYNTSRLFGQSNGATYTDLLAWQAGTGFDNQSQEINPLFVNGPQHNFNLQNISPARETGIFISGYHCPVNDETNPNQQGCRHWSGSAPDIGAIEYISSSSTNECNNWQILHPNWLFCDDFENGFGPWNQVDPQASLINTSNLVFDGTSARVVANIGGDDNFEFNINPGKEKLYVRYYLKLDAGSNWPKHMGGISAIRPGYWPNAGHSPPGDQAFWSSLEPIIFNGTRSWNFYSYWQEMHSWANPDGSPSPECEALGTCYYGNNFVPVQTEPIQKDRWYCIEAMLKANTPNQYDGEQAFWIDDILFGDYRIGNPIGNWLRDSFLTWGPYYNPGSAVPFEGYNWRNVSDLNITNAQLQWYFEGDGNSNDIVYYDNVVVSTNRIGCVGFSPPQSNCTLPLDFEPCGVDSTELGNAVSAWFRGDIGISVLVQYVNDWKS